jgi:outer membrane protein OmpA-like peptidoglycan-associated protein
MGLAVGASYDIPMGTKEERTPPTIELSYNYRPSHVFGGTHNIGVTFFGSKHSYCDELFVAKQVEKVAEIVKEKPVKQPEPEIRYVHDTVFKTLPAEVKTVVDYSKVNVVLNNFAGNIEFKTNTAILTDRGEGALSVIGEVLKGYPASKFNIAGHTDGDGTNEKNLRLSKLRSKTVARYLTEFKGIPETSIFSEWFGEEKPLASNETEEGNQRNRRVEIKLVDSRFDAGASNNQIKKETIAAVETKPQPTTSLPAKEEPKVVKTPKEELEEIGQNIRFKTGTDSLSKGQKRNIDKINVILKENPTMKVKIEAHTDNLKYNVDNKTLSENRAKAILEALKNAGVDVSRVSIEGFGDTKPVDNNDSETGRDKNRRIEIKVVN